jgi:hypothetical protein
VTATALVILLFLFFRGRPPNFSKNGGTTDSETPEAKATVVSPAASPSRANSLVNPPRVDGPPGSPGTFPVADRARFVATNSTAQRHAAQNDVPLQKAAASVRDYRIALHQNPVGNNAEITRALSGKNSRQTRYLSPDARTNDKGELIDRWDQPIFFHQISATQMEVRSAGPDHRLWTTDDEVLP